MIINLLLEIYIYYILNIKQSQSLYITFNIKSMGGLGGPKGVKI